MFENVNELTAFGFSYFKRKGEIESKKNAAKEVYNLEFMGKYQALPVIEVRIEFPVYRLNNGRTKSFQREYLAIHPEIAKDIFIRDHDSVEAQIAQHEILKALADEENLMRSFRHDNLQQTEPLISTFDGVIVNGNRRLCVWRELMYSDNKTYKQFETIKLAILPECDEQAIYDLEKRLQVQNTMKAEYHWHTIALMASEEIEQGTPLRKFVADSFGKSQQQINLMIECRQYAETYLQRNGTPDQWSLVDKDMHAFEQMVKGRRKVEGAGKKELFETLSFTFVNSSKNEGRLYELIPNIAENIDAITQNLFVKLDIADDRYVSDEVTLLSGEEVLDTEPYGLVAKKIQETDDQELIRKATIDVIDTQKQLKQERNAENFLLSQVVKAATLLTEAVAIGFDNENVNKKGISTQLSTISEKVSIIEKWLDESNGN